MMSLNNIISFFAYLFSFFPPAWVAVIVLALGVLIALAIKRIFF